MRCIYCYPPLANHIWKHWRANLDETTMSNTATDIPKGWQKISTIANNIIKACPFCYTLDVHKKIGNLEHLHLYYSSPISTKTRVHCYQKIEGAILDLYNYASVREFGTPFLENSQKTTLQENLETAAEGTEKAERAVIRHSN
jgi:hypothetical protein